MLKKTFIVILTLFVCFVSSSIAGQSNVKYYASNNGTIATISKMTFDNVLESLKIDDIDTIKKLKNDGKLVIIPPGTELNTLQHKSGIMWVKIKYNDSIFWTTRDQVEVKFQ